MAWNKIKFFYDSVPGVSGAVLGATTQRSDAPVENISNMMEVNMWEASGATDPTYITVDLGGANPQKAADYLVVHGHNLGSAGAMVVLQYSLDGLVYSDAFSAFTPASDAVILIEFTQTPAARYWRLKLTGHGVAPYLSTCIWGIKTELDYASTTFDPHAQEARLSVNHSYGGYLTGIHTQYIERSLSIRFEDADDLLYAKVRDWWETSGSRNFFVAWENANNPTEVFLMRPEARFYNPLKHGGFRRDITINLTGRKD